MGGFGSKLNAVFSKLTKDKTARILMLGLDSAGKTTILYRLKFDEVIQTVPTVGFNVETVSPCKGLNFTVWDVGGQDKTRMLWRYYFKDVDGLFFVIDSADRHRVEEATAELQNLCQYSELKGVPVVIVANKQDLPGTMSVFEVASKMSLKSLLRDTRWAMHAVSAKKGDGLVDAMETLVSMIKETRKNRHKTAR